MPRVDFYILPEAGVRERFTCDIATKIRQQELNLYIHADSREQAGVLDDLLWTYKDISFLPHRLNDTENSEFNTVTIGWEGVSTNSSTVLINLSVSVPEFVGDFERIVEIVASEDPYKQQARERYKQYKQAGFELHNHDLKSAHVLD
ncbi:MAG: DNA polymerase-3 subunit chi [Gammaproteobacteria bacterium]|jgi:DNA polymerase III subunit chi